MKFHRTYHPESWSAQARRMSDNLFSYVINKMNKRNEIFEYYTLDGEYRVNVSPDEWASHCFSTSYRADIITQRAAKRFGRKMKKLNKKK